MSGTATNRTNITLPADVSQEILQKTQAGSKVMQLARQTALPGRGAAINVITSDPTAAWVGETASKPVSNPGLTTKIMQAHKLAVIVPFSNEFRRDVASLYDALIERLPAALGEKFDASVFFGVSPSLANFDDLSGVTGHSIASDVYAGICAAEADVAAHGGIMNGIILAPQGKSALLSATDTSKRPLFNTPAEDAIPYVLGAATYTTKAAYKSGSPSTVGIVGDWTQALYGIVEGVKIDYSADATLDVDENTKINLFQQNMFAVRAEIEVGFRADTDCFAALTSNLISG